MNEKETYGVKITALVSEFKKKMQELANDTREFGKKAEENATVNFNFKNTGYTKEIEYVKDQMDAINDQIQAIKQGDMTGSVRELEVEYEQLGRKLENLTYKQAEFNGELEETNNEASGMSINLGKMFDKSISKIKRFTFYLLGARSVFSLFMKYQGIYYQYNEQMQYQSELSQNAIALSLAPAFELLGNVMTYASIAFAKFIELLTGVNVLSKVSTKGIRDYNKSLKETQTLVSGIDEITNLTLPSGTGLASQYKALEDFQKKVAEVEKWFSENTWVNDLVKGLKTAWEWIGKIIDGVGGVENALLLLGGVKVMSSLSTLLGSAGVAGVGGTGLLAIASVLGTIYGYTKYKEKQELFNTDSIKGDIDKLNEIINAFTKNTDYYEFRQSLSDIEKTIIPNIVKKLKADGRTSIEDISDDLDAVLDRLKKITGIDYKAKIKAQLEYDPKSEEGFINGLKSGFKTMFKSLRESTFDESEWDKSWKIFQDNAKNNIIIATNTLFDGILKTIESDDIDDSVRKKVKELISNTQADINTDGKVVIDDIEKTINGTLNLLGDNIDDKTKESLTQIYKEYINTMHNVITETDGTTVKIGDMLDDTFKERIFKVSMKYNIDKNSVLSLVNKVKGISSLMGVPTSTFDNLANKILKNFGYAKGLDYVPYDNYPAILHKGETVVPAKYNPTIHSIGNDYTNSLLETMIMKLDDYANRPIELDVDGQKFANATYGYYDNARNRQGYVEGVVR